MPAPDRDWEGVRLHVVTGKGGTGKTTVAAALALALAGEGNRVLLAEVEGRQGIAQLFDVPPLPYVERKVAVGLGGGEVLGLAVDAKTALWEYLQLFYKLGRAGHLLERFGVVDFATTVAPGMRDVLMTGKVYEAVRRRGESREAHRRSSTKSTEGPTYDAVVLDAPPTGRIARFLDVNAEVAGLARVGPIRNQADSITRLLHSPLTVVHVVTLLEEMPVQESLDALEELAAHDLPLGGIVVNAVREPVLRAKELTAAAAGKLDRSAIAEGLSRRRAARRRRRPRRSARRGGRARRPGRPREAGAEPDQGGRTADVPAARAQRRHRPGRAVRARPAAGRPGDDVSAARRTPTGRDQRPAGPALDLDAVLDDPATRIIVCCGSGGVGKTTTAAALALRAAEKGRTAVVLTIDPARRLAQSMGLSQLDNTPREVRGVDRSAGGRLDAMMLDMKRTFDEIVESHSPPEKAEQILANPFYQALSSSFAGTQEYMAMEKLGQLRAQSDQDGSEGSGGGWDLIVVDTPPSRSALDFLDAPQRLGSFLDGRLIKLLAAPARAGGRAYLKMVSAGVGAVTSALTKVLGAQVLTDVQQFVSALDTMFGGFRERADATYQLLKTPGTAFVVVAAPERDAMREASYFVERLAEEGMPLAGLVLNRVHNGGPGGLSAERSVAAAEALEEAQKVRKDAGQDLTARLLRLHAARVRIAAREDAMAARFRGAHPTVPTVRVRARDGDVHDLAGLRAVGSDLGADQGSDHGAGRSRS